MLHVRCGDDIIDRLRALGAGDALRWCDPVCDGPTPSGLRGAAWRAVRARHLADAYGRWTSLDEAAVRRMLAAEDRSLLAGAKQDEVVLWFEADLFDQAVLMALLARFGACLTRATRLSLVCIGAHPDVPRFIGLGQLSGEQLGALLPARVPVADAQLDLARRAWQDFCDPDPRAIEDLLSSDCTALPFLADALRRHLADLPDRRDGLGLTERRIMEIAAAAPCDPNAVFQHVKGLEPRPWLGDIMLWRRIADLAGGPAPLLTIEGPEDWWRDRESLQATRLRLAVDGARVLRGEADRLALGPVDRWLGGVHLHATGIDWRWDREEERIVRLN